MTAVEPKSDQATITVHNPADGRVAGTVPIDGPDTVAAKARELRLFQPEWEAIGPRGRKVWMMKWQDWVLDNADHLTEVLMSETGKSRGDAQPGAGHHRRRHQLLGRQRRGVSLRPASQGAHPAVSGQEADHRVPALPAGRDDRAVELPARHAGPRRGARVGRRCGGVAETL